MGRRGDLQRSGLAQRVARPADTLTQSSQDAVWSNCPALRDRNLKVEVFAQPRRAPSARPETSTKPQELQFDWLAVALSEELLSNEQQ